MPRRPCSFRTCSASWRRSRVNSIASSGVIGSMKATRSVGPNAVSTKFVSASRDRSALAIWSMWYSSQKIRNTRTSSRSASWRAWLRDRIGSDVLSTSAGSPLASTSLNDVIVCAASSSSTTKSSIVRSVTRRPRRSRTVTSTRTTSVSTRIVGCRCSCWGGCCVGGVWSRMPARTVAEPAWAAARNAITHISRVSCIIVYRPRPRQTIGIAGAAALPGRPISIYRTVGRGSCGKEVAASRRLQVSLFAATAFLADSQAPWGLGRSGAS